VFLAAGRPRRVSPHRILGKSIFWWMDKLGILRAARDSVVGRYLMRTDPFPGKDLELDRLRERGVTVVGRLTGVTGRQTAFAAGGAAEIDVVIWATGYRDESAWVAIPAVKDERGAFIQERGLSPIPGVAFTGRSWQWTRGSALLVGVGADADNLAQHLVQALSTSASVDTSQVGFQDQPGEITTQTAGGDLS
jgi:putative flavoprotein involved in K+ transport